MATNTRKPYTILIEGNIGVGKSTFLKYFEKFDSVETIPEPVKEWQNFKGTNLLELMYKDTEKWGFAFQSYAALLMLQNQMKPCEKKIKIMERSFFSGKYCFTELLAEKSKISKVEYDILREWNECIEKSFDIRPDLIIYLRAMPEKVYVRIKQRGRGEEESIDMDYIQRLHELHENWLVVKSDHVSVPVLILDASLNAEQVQKEFEKSRKQFFDY